MKDATECYLVEYDPTIVSFGDLATEVSIWRNGNRPVFIALSYRPLPVHVFTEVLVIFLGILFSRLVILQWAGHHYPYSKRSAQYRSIIFYANDNQKKTALNILQGLKASSRDEVFSSVEPMSLFYRAEEYHQKYTAKMLGGIRRNRKEY